MNIKIKIDTMNLLWHSALNMAEGYYKSLKAFNPSGHTILTGQKDSNVKHSHFIILGAKFHLSENLQDVF